jgi:hypothetical protein
MSELTKNEQLILRDILAGKSARQAYDLDCKRYGTPFDQDVFTEELAKIIVKLSAHPDTGKEDGERLDWLQSNPGSVYASVDPDGNRLQHFCAVPEKDQNGRRGYVAPTVREAIDQARAAQSAPNEGRGEQ